MDRGGGGGGGARRERGKQGQTIKNFEKKLKNSNSRNVHSFLPFVFRFVKWAIFIYSTCCQSVRVQWPLTDRRIDHNHSLPVKCGTAGHPENPDGKLIMSPHL